MTRDEALVQLRALMGMRDREEAHSEADRIVLELLDDDEIYAAWYAIPKWFA